MTKKLAVTFAAIAALAAVAAAVTWAVVRDDAMSPVSGYGPGMMGYAGEDVSGRYFAGMMGGDFGGMMGMMGYDVADAEQVRTLDAAQRRAQAFADELGLRAGEVMQFTNQFYVELLDQDARLATEVLVFPRTGRVQIEFGPAMMWNTEYGMGGVAGPGGNMGGDMMDGGMMGGFGGMMGGFGGMMGGGFGGMMGDGWADPTSPTAGEVSAEEAEAIATRWLAERRPGLVAGEAEAFPGYYTLHVLRDGRVAGMLSVHAGTGAVWYHSWHGRFVAMTE